MPKELIWGGIITVRDGDLPVVSARTRDDLAALDPAPTDPATDPATDLLRRRYQLLAAFVEALDETPDVRRLRDELRALTLDHRAATPVTPSPDLTPPSVPLEVDFRDPATELRLQQTVTVAWGREDLEVRLFTAAHDHDAGQPVDLGGHWVTLGWSAVNQLIRKLRAARDQAFGVPE